MNRIRDLWTNYKGVILGFGAVLGLCLLRFALGLPCPVEYLAGISCPGCGMTRALWSLVILDFAAAWHFHPAAFALPVAVLLLVLCRVKGLRRTANAMLIAFGVLMLLVYLWRIADGGGGVLVLDPQNGLIGRVLRRILSLFHHE